MQGGQMRKRVFVRHRKMQVVDMEVNDVELRRTLNYLLNLQNMSRNGVYAAWIGAQRLRTT